MVFLGNREIYGILFDNDDTAQAHNPEKGHGSPEEHYYAAFEAIALCFGKHLPRESELRKSVMGIPIAQVGEKMITELGLPITYKEWKEALDGILLELAPFAELAPGFEDAVVELQQRCVRVGIASSSTTNVLLAKWKRFGRLQYKLNCFVAGDDAAVMKGKPAPDLLWAAASQMNVSPSNCIYVGDSKVDMEAAIAAGMIGVLLRHPGRTITGLPRGVVRIDSFSELLELMTNVIT